MEEPFQQQNNDQLDSLPEGRSFKNEFCKN